MIISIDTDIIQNMASMAASSYTEVGQCVSVADRITTHNDWNCKERDVINESIVHTKEKIKQLYENLEGFSRALRQAADRFQSTEAEYIRMIQSLDCTIGSVLTVVPTETSVSATMANAATYTNDSVDLPHGIESYSVGNLTDPIRLCSFSDINFQNRGK